MREMLLVLLNKGNLQKGMKLPTYTVQKQFFKQFKKHASIGSQSVGSLKPLVFNLNSNQTTFRIQAVITYYSLIVPAARQLYNLKPFLRFVPINIGESITLPTINEKAE